MTRDEPKRPDPEWYVVCQKLAYVSAELLLVRMEEISEDHWAAGWMMNLEFDLWQIVKAGGGDYGMGTVSEAQARELLQLALDAGSWYALDEVKGPALVSLAEWEKRFAAWTDERTP